MGAKVVALLYDVCFMRKLDVTIAPWSNVMHANLAFGVLLVHLHIIS